MELATDSDAAAEFINALLPNDLQPSEVDKKKIYKELTE